jgi:hypothetical protein
MTSSDSTVVLHVNRKIFNWMEKSDRSSSFRIATNMIGLVCDSFDSQEWT